MKKVLFVINTLGRAGAEMALLELLKRIDKTKYQCDLFVITGQGEMASRIPEGVRLLNKKYYDIPVLDNEGRKRLTKTSIKALFKRANCIRLLPYLVSNMFSMLRKHRVLPEKLMWRVLSDAAERFDEEYDLAVAYIEGGAAYYIADHVKARKKVSFIHVDYNMAGYTRKLDRNCYAGFDRLFGVSDEVKDVFCGIYPECVEKMFVFHNFLDMEGIKQKALDEADFISLEQLAVEKYGAKPSHCNQAELEKNRSDGEKLLLTVGRLTAQKAFEVSIEACRLLRERGEKVVWYVLGEGNQRERLEALIKEKNLEDMFYLPGAVSNPYPYMKNCDIYVHCSSFEGKSIAIQEAQILGKAMVVSDCSGNREQVENGKDGIICDFEAGKIAESISLLLHDDEKCVHYGNAAAEKLSDSDERLSLLLDII